MPNWVKNVLRISGDENVICEMLAAVKDGDNHFSLNKVVPMPDFIKRGNLSCEDRKSVRNRYDWSVNYWGCKWNTTSDEVGVLTDDDGAEIEFETPLNRPQPVITALAFMFPELDFVHKYADEDIGYNVGTDYYAGGQMIKMDTFPKGGESAIRFACDMWGYDYDEYMEGVKGGEAE